MILHNRMMQRLLIGILCNCQDRRNVKTFGLPVCDCMPCIKHLNMANRFLQSLETKFRKVLAHLLSNVFKKVDNKLWLAAKALAQFWILRGDASVSP